MTFVPRFRPEVSVVEAEGDAPVLRDALLMRDLRLDVALGAVARGVDGQRTSDEVMALVAAEGITRPLAYRALRTLLLLGVFEDASHAVIEPLRALRDGLELPRGAVLPDMRFECQGSGDCCQNFSLGPLTADDEHRLDALPLAEAFPSAGGAYVESHGLPGGGVGRYLRKVDGGCVFLTKDARCGIHARFGADAKPITCKLFPLSHVVRYDGVHVYDRGECARFGTSSRAGEPMLKTPQRFLPLMQQTRRLEHPIVQLSEGLVVDYGHYAPLVELAIEECAMPSLSAPEVLRALGRRVTTFSAQLDEAPLAPGAPAAVLRQILAMPRARFYVPPRPENLTPGCKAVALLSEALLLGCDRALAEIPEGHPQDYVRGQVRQLKPVLNLIRELSSALVEPHAAPERHIAAGFVSADLGELREVSRVSLRQSLFGRQCLLDDRAFPALGRLAFVHLVTVFAARHQAPRDAAQISSASLDPAHAIAQRGLMLEPLRKVFVEASGAVPALLEALPFIAHWR